MLPTNWKGQEVSCMVPLLDQGKVKLLGRALLKTSYMVPSVSVWLAGHIAGNLTGVVYL